MKKKDDLRSQVSDFLDTYVKQEVAQAMREGDPPSIEEIEQIMEEGVRDGTYVKVGSGYRLTEKGLEEVKKRFFRKPS